MHGMFGEIMPRYSPRESLKRAGLKPVHRNLAWDEPPRQVIHGGTPASIAAVKGLHDNLIARGIEPLPRQEYGMDRAVGYWKERQRLQDREVRTREVDSDGEDEPVRWALGGDEASGRHPFAGYYFRRYAWRRPETEADQAAELAEDVRRAERDAREEDTGVF